MGPHENHRYYFQACRQDWTSTEPQATERHRPLQYFTIGTMFPRRYSRTIPSCTATNNHWWRKRMGSWRDFGFTITEEESTIFGTMGRRWRGLENSGGTHSLSRVAGQLSQSIPTQTTANSLIGISTLERDLLSQITVPSFHVLIVTWLLITTWSYLIYHQQSRLLNPTEITSCHYHGNIWS